MKHVEDLELIQFDYIQLKVFRELFCRQVGMWELIKIYLPKLVTENHEHISVQKQILPFLLA